MKKLNPTILAVIGSVGVIATGVTCVKATIECIDILTDDTLNKRTRLKKCAPFYLLPAATAGATIACIMTSDRRHRKIEASSLALCQFLSSSMKDYKAAVEEVVTEEQLKEIDIVVAGGLVERYQQKDPSKLVMVDNFLKIPFEITEEDYLKAIYHMNRQFALEGEVSLGNFYNYLGIPETSLANRFFWCVAFGEIEEYVWLDITREEATDDQGNTFYIIHYGCDPELDAHW